MNNDYSGVKLPNGEVVLFEGNGNDTGNYIEVDHIDGINTAEENNKNSEQTELLEVSNEENSEEVAESVEDGSISNSILINVNGNEVDYFQYSYIEQVKTNLYLQMLIVLIPSILILKWLYGGIKKLFHVSI